MTKDDKTIYEFDSKNLAQILLEHNWICEVETDDSGKDDGIVIKIPLHRALAQYIVTKNAELFNARIKEEDDDDEQA